MDRLTKKAMALAAAVAVMLPCVISRAGTEAFVNGGNNDFVGNYGGTQDNTFQENNTASQDNTNGGSLPYLDAEASSSHRYRFMLDFDLSALSPYASQITISNVALGLTSYNTSSNPFSTDTYAIDAAIMAPANYGWSQSVATGEYYNPNTTPPTDWMNFNGQPVNPPLDSSPSTNPALAYNQLFNQSATDPQDFMASAPIGTHYTITDGTGAFLTAVQNWIANPTQNAGLFFQDYENSGDAANMVLQYYSDIATNAVANRPALILTVSSPTMTTDWAADASDIWSNDADWDNGSPNTIGSTVNFGDVTTSQRTITLDAPKVVSNLSFSSPYGYIIAGTNALSIIEVNNNLATMTVAAGDNTISAPVIWNTNTNVNVASGASMSVTGGITGGALINYAGPGPLILSAGSSGGLTASNGTVTVNGAMAMNGPLTLNGNSTVVINGPTTATQIGGDGTGTLNIAGGSLIPSAQPTGIITLAGLSLTGGGKLDIADSNLTLNYSGTSPLAAIQTDLANGYAAGAWTGNGLVSSYVAATPGTGLGYEDTGSQIIIQIAWLGDLDLDGSVTTADEAAMGVIPTTGPEAGLIGWFDGDLNYDGKINADDWSLFQLGAALSGGAPIAVPEPAALGLLAVGAIAMIRRRRPSC